MCIYDGLMCSVRMLHFCTRKHEAFLIEGRKTQAIFGFSMEPSSFETGFFLFVSRRHFAVHSVSMKHTRHVHGYRHHDVLDTH